MLRYLSIQNLAVIESVDVEFQQGLNVLTGETGAGKSILVEAVGLLMGDRASPELVRTGAERAVVQAVFETEAGREVIVRREVGAEGRSRAFLDGSLVAAAALKDATAPLVELHGQHEHQTLLDPEKHLDLLDGYAGLGEQRAAVASTFGAWHGIHEELTRLQIDEREKAARLDLLRFQAHELERAALRPGEDDELTAIRRVLANAEKLQRWCTEAYGALYEGDQAALPQLSHVWRKVAELAEIEPGFQAYIGMREGIKNQLEDLAFALRDFSRRVEASPEKLQVIEERLVLLERLKRKYGPTLAETIAARDRCAQQIDAFEHAEERTASLTSALQRASEDYLRAAQALSSVRRRAAADFSRALVQSLKELAMDRTRFEVRFDHGALEGVRNEDGWSERGIDRAECYISPNPGEDLRPLARIASGGELSRIMLAVKALATAETPGKALIFDEVDAGIGGRVADVVGRKLRKLGGRAQVLCITHLPQVAAHAVTHFHISKDVRQGRTVTAVTRLNDTERVEELARMLGGRHVTDGARASARELLRFSESESKAKGESEGAKAKRERGMRNEE
jgi:DNA repair protein RecN (Recombination protein N)